MSEEKKINRDIIYICEKQEKDEKTGSSKILNTEKPKIKTIFGETASLAGAIVSAVTPFTIVGVVTSVMGAAMSSPDNEDIFKTQTYKKNNTMDDAIQNIPIDFAEEFFKHDDIKLKGFSNFSVGMILAKHPFLKNTYVNIDDLEKEILHNKLSCLSLIAEYIGAKSISGHAVIAEEQKRIHDVSGNVTYEVINVSLQGKKEEYQKYESKYSLDDAFTGDFTIESYEHAKAEAARFGLDEDIEIRNLIEQRNPEYPRSIISRKLTIELSREYNKAIDAAFSLSVPGIQLSAGYKGILESRKTVLFNMEIKF